MNKGFIKLSLLFVGLLSLVGLVGYLVSANKVGATTPACKWSEWTDTSKCEPVKCGTSEGIKTQERVCEAQVYTCEGVVVNWKTYTVKYEKSEDPTKCHRPSDDTLKNDYGMDKDTRGAFKKDNKEWLDAISSSEVMSKESREVKCKAEVIACEVKHATVVGACDGSAVITIYAGDTRRTWRVDGGDKFWLDYYESKEVKGTIDSKIEWWHREEWQEFDPTLTYRTPATGCDIPTPTPTEEPKRGTTEASAPQCTDRTPLILPSNPHVIRSGSDATVNFFTQSSNANIYYKEVSATGWQHALRDIPVTGGYVSVTIHDLVPALGYTFGVQAANSCAGGETVLAVVVDGPESVTFGFSYWEWLK